MSTPAPKAQSTRDDGTAAENEAVRFKNHLGSVFYNVSDINSFSAALQLLLNHMQAPGVFTGDNLVTFAKNLSFLYDQRFMEAFARETEGPIEQSHAWRLHTLCWAAHRALRLDGDFVECGCYRGTSARIVADYVDLAATDRSFQIYDLFERDENLDQRPVSEREAQPYDSVCRRFADLPNVHVHQGAVPAILSGTAPDTIAYLHIDSSGAVAVADTLEALFDRVTPGGSIVFDDYGWLHYRGQKTAADAFFAERGYQVLELPTGQGLVIK